MRQGPTSQIVQAAREQGEVRVVKDKSPDAQRKRDDLVRAKWQDVDMLNAVYDAMYKEPFEEKGGYAMVVSETA